MVWRTALCYWACVLEFIFAARDLEMTKYMCLYTILTATMKCSCPCIAWGELRDEREVTRNYNQSKRNPALPWFKECDPNSRQAGAWIKIQGPMMCQKLTRTSKNLSRSISGRNSGQNIVNIHNRWARPCVADYPVDNIKVKVAGENNLWWD